MQTYMKLKIPTAPKVTKSRLGLSQPTQKLSLTQLRDKLHPVLYVPPPGPHKTSMRDRRSHLHLIAYLGVSVSIKDKVNAMATLSVPEVTLLNAVTSDHQRGQMRGLEYNFFTFC